MHTIIIDCREKLLIESVKYLKSIDTKFSDIEIEIKNLDLGDIIIQDECGNDILIIERKTVSDLLSSIKDGRYNEQSYRLNTIDHHNHNIIYLIEGNKNKLISDKQMIFSAIFSINYYKGFSTRESDNVQESAYILLNMCLKLNKEKDKKAFYSTSKEVETEDKEEKKYSSVVKKKKNSNITPENFGEIVLCQVPSVSSITAVAIMEQFKTINNLIEKIKEDPNCLNDVTYITSSNKKRKISKTCIKNILEFLNN